MNDMEAEVEAGLWREAMARNMDALRATQESMGARQDDFDRKLHENTEVTLRVEKSTGDIVTLFNSAKGAFDVLERLGKLAKPLAQILGLFTAVGAALAAFFHFGGHK